MRGASVGNISPFYTNNYVTLYRIQGRIPTNIHADQRFSLQLSKKSFKITIER